LGASLFNIWEVRNSWGRTSDFYNCEITVGTTAGELTYTTGGLLYVGTVGGELQTYTSGRLL
jgi:hypothetical protein